MQPVCCGRYAGQGEKRQRSAVPAQSAFSGTACRTPRAEKCHQPVSAFLTPRHGRAHHYGHGLFPKRPVPDQAQFLRPYAGGRSAASPPAGNACTQVRPFARQKHEVGPLSGHRRHSAENLYQHTHRQTLSVPLSAVQKALCRHSAGCGQDGNGGRSLSRLHKYPGTAGEAQFIRLGRGFSKRPLIMHSRPSGGPGTSPGQWRCTLVCSNACP